MFVCVSMCVHMQGLPVLKLSFLETVSHRASTQLCSYGGLDENGPYRLIYFNAWFSVGRTVLGRTGRYALLERCVTGVGVEVSETTTASCVVSTCKLSATAPAPFLPA